MQKENPVISVNNLLANKFPNTCLPYTSFTTTNKNAEQSAMQSFEYSTI